MALITSPTQLIPDLQHEYHTVTIDTIGQTASNTFTCHLQNPLKNVVQAKLLAANINTTVATKHCYVSIEELDSIFTERASNEPNGQAATSIVRNSFASIIGDGTASFNFKDNYPLVTQYVNPIRSIDRFTVNIRNQNGVPITPSSPAKNNFLVIRFVCRKPNL
jgi:hypothetical protein